MKRKKNKEHAESQITTVCIIGFTLYFPRKHNLKKSFLYHQILFTVFMIAGHLKHSNDTSNLNIHKYTIYNIILYINRLSTTTQIFLAMDCLIIMSEKCLYYRKRKKTFGKDIFYPPNRTNWIHLLWNFFQIMCLSKICTKTYNKLE